MRGRRRVPVAMLATLTAALTPVFAQQNSAEREHAFAALPNRTGLWETDVAADQLSGFSYADVLKRAVLLGTPPYNAEWKRKAAESHKKDAGLGKACHAGLVGTFPAVMDSIVPDDTFEAVVTPEETLFVFPDGTVRHIYTDGRGHPKPEDLWPTSLGDSIGRWEGTTLIIDTVARKAGPILPVLGKTELSEHAHFTERIRRLDADTMENKLSIDDPQRFVHPWQLTILYKRVANLDRMIETDCSENDRNPIVNGREVVAPPK